MKTLRLLLKQFPLVHALRFELLTVIRRKLSPYSYLSYSQTGEDIIIQTILNNVEKGFYIEVGSNEPIQHSNTFGLYQNGWQGITIDANPLMVEMHKKVRPNDIAICAAISNEEKEVTFYEFDMDEISTIDQDFYEKHKDIQRINNYRKVITQTLNSIILEKTSPNLTIDLLSIDVEGHDYQVLKSIDLTKYRPKLIVIEMHKFQIHDPLANEIYAMLMENNYRFVGYAIWNGYFVSEEFDTAI